MNPMVGIRLRRRHAEVAMGRINRFRVAFAIQYPMKLALVPMNCRLVRHFVLHVMEAHLHRKMDHLPARTFYVPICIRLMRLRQCFVPSFVSV
jgi:hypothetical protein